MKRQNKNLSNTLENSILVIHDVIVYYCVNIQQNTSHTEQISMKCVPAFRLITLFLFTVQHEIISSIFYLINEEIDEK